MPRFIAFLLALACWLAPSLVQARSVKPGVDTVMQKVFSFSTLANAENKSFEADVYVRYTLKTRRFGILMRYVPGMFPLERGTNKYIGENHIKYTYRPGIGLDRKEVAYFSTLPRQRQTRNREFRRFNVSIYSSNLFNDRILSPVSRANRKFYKYEDVYCYSSGNDNYCRIRVKPKFHNTQLVSGTIDVSVSTGKVKSFDLSMFYDMTRLKIKGEMDNEGVGSLFPTSLDVSSKFSLLGNRVEANYKVFAKYADIGISERKDEETRKAQKNKFDITHLYTLKIDTAKSINSKSYFDSIRPYPLTEYEKLLYGFQNAKQNLQRLKSALPSRAKVRKIFTPTVEDVLLGSHDLDLGSSGNVKVPALITPSMYQWSKSKGFYMQARFRANVGFTETSYASSSPRVGYNFKQNQLYWSIPATFCLYSPKDVILNIEGGNGNRIYNSEQSDELRKKLQGISQYDSLMKMLDTYELHYYNDLYFKTDIGFQPFMGLKLSLGINYHNRRLVERKRLPLLTGFQKVFKSFAPRFHAEWTPALYFINIDKKRYPMHSGYPTFMFDYERGVPWGKCQSEYEKWEMDIKYGISLNALRMISLRLGGGFYTNMQKTYFVDYGYFRDNNMPLNWEDEMSGQFQLLDSRFYNESRYYARLSAAYESPMLGFSRIKFLSKFIQKERIYCNVLSVHAFTPYIELGYGLATHILDIGAFCSFAKGENVGLGCKLALRLFDDW